MEIKPTKRKLFVNIFSDVNISVRFQYYIYVNK